MAWHMTLEITLMLCLGTSSLNIAIYRIFKEHNIEIPYPRRNVQIYRPLKEQGE